MLKDKIKQLYISKKQTIILIAFSALVSFAVLCMCSKSSFLYSLNDWVDANCFFSVGKTMANGGVVYRDIFEQKGPLLYVIHMLAYFISNNNFIGVFVFEVLAGTAFVFLSAKIMLLYKCKIGAFLFAPIFTAVVYSSNAFCQGDSAEEFCLPLLMYCFYISLKAFNRNRFFSRFELVMTGVAGGCVLLIKFTMLGFFIGWIIMPVVWLLKEKKLVNLLKTFLYIIAGVAITVIPFVIYFALNNALDDFFKVYFYDNIFIYSTVDNDATFINKIRLMIIDFLKNVFYAYKNNLLIYFFTLTGIVYSVLCDNRRVKLNNIFLFVFTILFIFGGGRKYDYYALPLSVFSIIGFVCIASATQKLLCKKPKGLSVVSIVMSCVCTVAIAVVCSPNVPFIKVSKDELAQYQFKDTINSVDNATLLNYGTLDNGFYTVCNIVPNCKYFCGLNIPVDDIKIEQQKYVEQGKTDFIVTRGKEPEKFKNYACIDTATSPYKGGKRTYYLYQRKN